MQRILLSRRWVVGRRRNTNYANVSIKQQHRQFNGNARYAAFSAVTLLSINLCHISTKGLSQNNNRKKSKGYRGRSQTYHTHCMVYTRIRNWQTPSVSRVYVQMTNNCTDRMPGTVQPPSLGAACIIITLIHTKRTWSARGLNRRRC